VPSFRIAWSASLVSNTGSWLQQLAVPVVVYEITGKTRWLGISSALGLICSALTTLMGGALADRHDRRTILIMTNLVQGAAATFLWIVWATGHARVTLLLGALAVSGLAGGVAVSTWQSIQALLVPRQHLLSAVRLNSTQYAISRALGPALGAVVLRQYGASVCFALNAASFLGVVVAMTRVTTRAPEIDAPTTRHGIRVELREGWNYLRSDSALWYPTISVLYFAGFAVTWTALAAAISAKHFGHLARDSGWLVTSYGVASVFTAVTATRLQNSVRRSRMFILAVLAAGVGLATIAATRTYALGLVGMSLLGVGHICSSMSLNTSVQLHAAEALRGRVTALFLQCSLIGHALGGLLNAELADTFSVRTALLVDAGLLAVPALVMGRRLLSLDRGSVVAPPPPLVTPRC
jgi:MFS family permease